MFNFSNEINFKLRLWAKWKEFLSFLHGLWIEQNNDYLKSQEKLVRNSFKQ